MTITHRFLALLLFAVLLVFAPSALAVDGVILINQHTSVAGVPGCPHAGFPLMICQSGSYRLTGHLTVPDVNTDGIDITADNVTLDLNGFTILGPVTCPLPGQCSATGSGIGVKSGIKNSNTTVRNGTVRGMGNTGVSLGDASLVEDVHAESNGSISGAGIRITGGVVTHCTSRLNAGDGINGGAAGMISFNTVEGNGAFGIDGGNLLSNNCISFNLNYGISRTSGEVNLAVNNVVIANAGGINLTGSSASGYMGNVFSNNGGNNVSGGTSMGHNLCDAVAC